MRMQERLNGTKPFLWIDEDPARRQHLRSGEVVVLPLGKSSTTPVPHGLIHHWIGGVFIPGAQREELIAVMNDYSSYDKIYRPTVIKAELLDSAGDEQKFSMLWVQRVLFVTVALYAQFDSNSIQLNRRQGYLTLPSTSVQQIEHYGQSGERKLAPDEGSGYLWRVASFVRYEERDGGLYLELEVIGLSRDLPASLRFLLRPVIDHVPRQALSVKLEQTREAVRLQAAKRVTALKVTAPEN